MRIKFILLLSFFGSISLINAQTLTNSVPKPPSESYKRLVTEKKPEEAKKIAKQFARQFRPGDWKEDESLNLAHLFIVAESFPEAEETLKGYLKNAAAANPSLARRLLLRTFVGEKKQEKYATQGLKIIGVMTFYGFIGKSQTATADEEAAALKKLQTDYNLNLVSLSAREPKTRSMDSPQNHTW